MSVSSVLCASACLQRRAHEESAPWTSPLWEEPFIFRIFLGYPLGIWHSCIAIEHGPFISIYNEFSHWKLWFFIVNHGYVFFTRGSWPKHQLKIAETVPAVPPLAETSQHHLNPDDAKSWGVSCECDAATWTSWHHPLMPCFPGFPGFAEQLLKTAENRGKCLWIFINTHLRNWGIGNVKI